VRAKTLNLPNFGFWILVASYVSAVIFLCFGSQKPRLEAAFDVLSRREREDFSAYTAKDIQLLEGVLRDYPGFVRALVGRSSARFLSPRVDGWLRLERAHLALRPERDEALSVSFEVRGSPREFPVSLTLDGHGQRKQLTFETAGIKSIEFAPNELRKPGILDFQVQTTKIAPDASATVGVRIAPQASPTPTREAP
jgi:hypothetical protein